jgi:hypothetical protein
MDTYGKLRECLGEFTDGFNSKREYKIQIGNDLEIRSESIHHPPLIHQLETHSQHPKAKNQEGAGDPNKPGSRPPASLDALALLELIQDTYNAYRADIGLPPHTSHIAALRGLATSTTMDDNTLRACLASFKLLNRRARVLLGYEAQTVLIEGHVCGECGGAIRVAVDWSIDPRCAGSPTTYPCGTVYPRWRLAMDHVQGMM